MLHLPFSRTISITVRIMDHIAESFDFRVGRSLDEKKFFDEKNSVNYCHRKLKIAVIKSLQMRILL